MEGYLGICLITVVAGIVISAVTNVIAQGILNALENYKSRRTARVVRAMQEIIKSMDETIKKSIEKIELKKDKKEDDNFAEKIKEIL